MTVGFIMLAHRALHRAAQTAQMLNDRNCPVIIHVDQRTDDAEFGQLEEAVQHLEFVTLAPRVKTIWGTWSLVDVSQSCAQTLLDTYPKLSHVCLISGACLPIKSIGELTSYLKDHATTDFIESVTIEEVPWAQGGLGKERFTLNFPFAWREQRRLFDLWVDLQRRLGFERAMPQGMRPHMGSQWWCLTRETLEHILGHARRDEFEAFFRKVWIPDESYFQTLVRVYGRKVESRSLTLTHFDFQGRPHVFYDDHAVLLGQSQEFFARKVWSGADQLYETFLDIAPNPGTLADAIPSHVDKTFVKANARRTRGRNGLVMAGRLPKPATAHLPTAAPYAVFHGLSDVFENFPEWVMDQTSGRTHGHLFARDKVEFAGGGSKFAGVLTDNHALRDYDPDAFLRNLIWNTRGEHQSFLFSPRDDQGVCKMIARDRNASVTVVSGAWVLPLLRSARPIDDVRKCAALHQKVEAEFIALLTERRVQARVNIVELLDILERPQDILQTLIDDITGTKSQTYFELPNFKPLDGLAEFIQLLRNAGMNPYLAGNVGHSDLTQTHIRMVSKAPR